MRSSRCGIRHVGWRFVKMDIFDSYDSLSSDSSRNNLPSDSDTDFVSSSLELARSKIVLSTTMSIVFCKEVMNID